MGAKDDPGLMMRALHRMLPAFFALARIEPWPTLPVINAGRYRDNRALVDPSEASTLPALPSRACARAQPRTRTHACTCAHVWYGMAQWRASTHDAARRGAARALGRSDARHAHTKDGDTHT